MVVLPDSNPVSTKFRTCFLQVFFPSAMASTFEASSSTQVPNTNEGSNSSTLLITGHKLNGHNYLQWSHSAMMFICGQGKDDYLTGATPKPKTEDPKYKAWKTENNIVMSWLISSMTYEVGEDFILYETTQEIQAAAKETYSDTKDTAEAFEIEGILHDFRQGDLTVTQYFSQLTRYE